MYAVITRPLPVCKKDCFNEKWADLLALFGIRQLVCDKLIPAFGYSRIGLTFIEPQNPETGITVFYIEDSGRQTFILNITWEFDEDEDGWYRAEVLDTRHASAVLGLLQTK